jgi:hypothetical protein
MADDLKTSAKIEDILRYAGASGPTQAYVDAADALRVLKAGDSMTGVLKFPDGTPVLPSQAFTSAANSGRSWNSGTNYMVDSVLGVIIMRYTNASAESVRRHLFSGGMQLGETYVDLSGGGNYNRVTGTKAFLNVVSDTYPGTSISAGFSPSLDDVQFISNNVVSSADIDLAFGSASGVLSPGETAILIFSTNDGDWYRVT